MHIAVATSTCVMIVNAAAATRRHQKAGNILRAYVWPLAGYIAVGAALGALAAMRIDGGLVRLAFIAYLAVTLADCLLRQGFLAHDGGGQPRPLGGAATAGGGLAIGAVAAFLGVGGSVMTVPLLPARPADGPGRGHGQSADAARGRGRHAGLCRRRPRPARRSGAVDGRLCGPARLRPAVTGIAGGHPAGRAADPRIPDRLHARAYLALLALVLLGMLLA